MVLSHEWWYHLAFSAFSDHSFCEHPRERECCFRQRVIVWLSCHMNIERWMNRNSIARCCSSSKRANARSASRTLFVSARRIAIYIILSLSHRAIQNSLKLKSSWLYRFLTARFSTICAPQFRPWNFVMFEGTNLEVNQWNTSKQTFFWNIWNFWNIFRRRLRTKDTNNSEIKRIIFKLRFRQAWRTNWNISSEMFVKKPPAHITARAPIAINNLIGDRWLYGKQIQRQSSSCRRSRFELSAVVSCPWDSIMIVSTCWVWVCIWGSPGSISIYYKMMSVRNNLVSTNTLKSTHVWNCYFFIRKFDYLGICSSSHQIAYRIPNSMIRFEIEMYRKKQSAKPFQILPVSYPMNTQNTQEFFPHHVRIAVPELLSMPPKIEESFSKRKNTRARTPPWRNDEDKFGVHVCHVPKLIKNLLANKLEQQTKSWEAEAKIKKQNKRVNNKKQ